MGSDAKKSLGAEGRGDLLFFDPDTLVLVEDPSHPLYDERVHLPVPEWLIESVMEVGVLEPIGVRKNGVREDNTPIVEVSYGRQRTKAAREANKRLRAQGKELVRIPAVVKRGDAADLFGMSITENQARQADPPMVLARKMQRYLDMGRDMTQTARTFCMTKQTVKVHLKLLELHPELQKMIDSGKLSINVAKKLVVFPQEQQVGKLDEIVNGALANAETTEEEQASESPESGERESSVEIRNTKNVRENIDRVVGDRGKIRLRTIKNRKEIEAFRASLMESKSDTAQIAAAALGWAIGDVELMNKYPVLKRRNESMGMSLDGDAEE